MHLDLNLLTALDALLEEGSVAGAAARLHVTPPAMSRSLGRIRKATGDQILVRTGRTMSPTPHALAIRGQVHDLVQRAHAVLSADKQLDLPTLERVFTVRWHDALAAARGSALIAGVCRDAPGVQVRLIAESGSDTPELRRGEVDLESGSALPEAPDIRSRLIGEDRLVVALRPGHPLAGGPLTTEHYTAAQHLTVSRRGRLADPVDDALDALGLRRHVVVAAPTTAVALRLARDTDLLACVPDAVTRTTRRELGLATLALPVELPAIPLFTMWHRRYDNDLAHAWFRDRAAGVLEALFTPPTAPR
ncbi:LysR family transcriptional regulator [Streptomyces actuosus]|uniref:LysR family transcriptional regulator n=1 Tax=Streptomyces actuosus TaxID=1885 RepID=A0ABS2VZE1_STRAS|nr:LysR family transcriptional regulator [Streptomyces actuosus]MBN0048511.1 LysR family transcriptional regulator [Streptomyces actuosus]